MSRGSPLFQVLLLCGAALPLASGGCSDSRASIRDGASRAGPLGASVEYLASSRDEFAESAASELEHLRARRAALAGGGAGADAALGDLLEEEEAALERLDGLRSASPREWELLRPGMRRCLEDLRSAVEALESDA